MSMDLRVPPPFKPANGTVYICENIRRTHSHGIFYGMNPFDFSFTLLMFELFFIVSTTRIIRFILKPLQQPRFVSDILGGMVIGPSMLGRNKIFLKYILPQNAKFTIQNLGIMGYIYYLFLSGVKMDLTLAKNASKKTISMAAIGSLVPCMVGLVISFSIRKSMEKELARPQILVVITCLLSITSFPVIEQIIKELNLLSSEVGRLALAIIITIDVVGINCFVVFEAARQYHLQPMNTLWIALSAIGFGSFTVACRHMLVWIVKATPEGKPVHETYIVMILLGVLVASFSTDITGLNMAIGPFWLGIVVPTGPPLGATLVEKLETIVNEFLMPFGYAFLGMMTDLTSLGGNWGVVWPLSVVSMGVYLVKFGTIFGVSRFYELPAKDSLALSFLLGIRGQLELMTYMHWCIVQVIPTPSYTILVVLSILIAAISTPMIRILYDPTRPYMVNTRRAIQFTAPDTDLRFVLCLHDLESVAGFADLLELSNPTASNPFTIYALRLIELVGRSHPVFIDHENQVEAVELTGYNRIHNAIMAMQESIGEYIKCHLFTSVSPTRTMYQDICDLALTRKATIIILPFRTESLGGQTEVLNDGVLRSINTNVLSHSPCSVGILVDGASPFPNQRTKGSMRREGRSIALLFLGGADAREALAYADRMASSPDVSLSVIRFLPQNGEGDDPLEKKLDDGLITWFWVKNERNERVMYREAIVSNGAETVLGIRAMMEESFYALWIVGRKNGINQVLIQGLSNWSQNDELGVIGDYITSVDAAMSVLVIQQQVLRDDDGRR